MPHFWEVLSVTALFHMLTQSLYHVQTIDANVKEVGVVCFRRAHSLVEVLAGFIPWPSWVTEDATPPCLIGGTLLRLLDGSLSGICGVFERYHSVPDECSSQFHFYFIVSPCHPVLLDVWQPAAWYTLTSNCFQSPCGAKD